MANLPSGTVTFLLTDIEGSTKLAARLYGAAEAQREREGELLDRADAQFIAPLIDKARVELGERTYQQLFQEGKRLTAANAMAEARAWLEENT